MYVSRKIDQNMVPGDGIEPSTQSSSGSRSTTELPRRNQIDRTKGTFSKFFVNKLLMNLLQLSLFGKLP